MSVHNNSNRVQPAHPKKQLFSVPVSKFTAKSSSPGPHLARLRSCLDAYQSQTPARQVKIGPKAVSMEDLTPTKRIRRERKGNELTEERSEEPYTGAEQAAAARVCRVMMLACWRRRRAEMRCLRKTLEFQVSCSERLRMQVSALKSLLDSDNAKVRLAMRELERLKQLLRDKDMEKAVLEREKYALENDICAAEDRASEMSIGWRNCRNELEGVRASAAVTEHALSLERAAAAEARLQRDHAFTRLAIVEEDLSTHEELLAGAEEEIAELKRDNNEKQRMLEQAVEKLRQEQEARESSSRQCAELSKRVDAADAETSALSDVVRRLQAEIARLDAELRATRTQLDWWPRPLTKMLGAARSFFRYPVTLPEAVLWSMVPARHGC
ncbi:myosin-14-like [Pectinophora gossypiella]|uniref:myosin-14-like n=1 Tax=Pectinophora gossypiella TaxID=13191 RepID=UPI00214EC08A|nr:myosin-14-like [Pectinophora gossypiella]